LLIGSIISLTGQGISGKAFISKGTVRCDTVIKDGGCDHGVSGMNTTVAETLTGRERVTRVCKYFVRRVMFPILVLCPFAYFFPKIAILYLACGVYDVSRNKGLNLSTVRRYFIGNGLGFCHHSTLCSICCRCHTSIKASIGWRICHPLIRRRWSA